MVCLEKNDWNKVIWLFEEIWKFEGIGYDLRDKDDWYDIMLDFFLKVYLIFF